MSFGTHAVSGWFDISVLGVPKELADVHEHVLFEGLEGRLPGDPASETWVFSGGIAPGADTGWHIHNGVGYSVILRGAVRMESEEGVRVYHAGEVFTEPMGVVHRAVNIDPDTVMVAVQFQITPPDRPHTTEVAGFVPKESRQ